MIIGDMASKPVIEHGGDEPFYNWREDRVKIPHRGNFILSDEYYATLFHELAHNAAKMIIPRSIGKVVFYNAFSCLRAA